MKRALPFLIFLFTISMLRAQTMPGLRVGGSYSKINGISTTKGSYDWLQLAHGGLMLTHKVGDKLYIQPELLYSQKGYRYRIDRNNKWVYGDTIKYQEKNKINYLELPLLAKIETNDIYVEVGPQFSYFLNGKRTETRTTSTNGLINAHGNSRDLHHIVDKFDIGFLVGVGYQFKSGLGIGGRYNQSFKALMYNENWKRLVALQVSTFFLLGKHKDTKLIPSPISPAISVPDVVYYDESKAYPKSYRVISKINVNRINFTKIADSKQLQIEYRIISTGVSAPQDIIMAGSSGSIVNSGIVLGHREIAFPFQGNIQFSVPVTIGTNTLMMSKMEYEINEPGHWRITITVSR
jgi:hypothetical protein